MSATDLLQMVLQRLASLGVLRTRKMFGGTYIYCDDLFIATVHDGVLYFKANANTASEFIARACPVFSYPTRQGVVTLQYYRAPADVFERPEVLAQWGRLALLAARQDAAQATKKSRRPRSGR
jgi:DNA transformation protein and related proteins